MASTRSTLLANGRIGPLLLRLSLPPIAGMAVSSLCFVVDAIYLGKAVGPAGIGAVAVAAPIQMLLVALIQAIGIGGASRISRCMGAKDRDGAGYTLGVMLLIGLLAGIIYLTIGVLFPIPLLRLFGATDTLLPSALSYFRIMILSSPLLSLTILGENAVRAEGNAKICMVTVMIGTGLNIVLDPILILWAGLGLRGAAVAVALSDTLAALFLFFYFLRGKSEIPMGRRYIRWISAIVGDIFAVGSASLIGAVIMSLTTILLNNTMRIFGGDNAIAAFGIVMRLMMLCSTPLTGLAQGLQPIVGYNYGAKNFPRVTGSIRAACNSAILLTITAFFFFGSFPGTLIRWFTDDPGLIEAGRKALYPILLSLPLVGYQTVAGSIFQSLGKPGPAILYHLTRKGLLQIPLLVTLPFFFGLNGVWYSIPLSDAMSFGITLFLTRRVLEENPDFLSAIPESQATSP